VQKKLENIVGAAICTLTIIESKHKVLKTDFKKSVKFEKLVMHLSLRNANFS